MKQNTFLGYKRETGRPGIRNHLLVLNATGLTEQTARRVCAALNGAVLASTPYGMGMLGPDRIRTERALCGLAANPNCGAVLILSADRPRCDLMCEFVAATGKPFAAVCFDEVDNDSLTMTDRALREATRLFRIITRQQREPFPISELCVGLECGLSDPSSGMAANPLIGQVTDMLVDAGATVIMGETLEWLGTEDGLAERAASADVGLRIKQAVQDLEALAIENGVDLLGVNPNAANIRGGLSTIEEKAVGSIAKSGSAVISSVLDYGEAPGGAGFHLMQAPAYTPESLTGFVAAGAQAILFSTGLGNSYTSAIAPTIKISANDRTVQRLREQIEFSAAPLLDGLPLDQAAKALTSELLEVASGKLTFGEILKEGSESISRFGASL